jgi:ABC-2 type transport system ATP-binding protein
MTPSTTMIRAHGLTYRVGGATPVDRVELEIRRGQCVALTGPRGAGRAILLRLIGTLLRPAAGGLELAGVDAIATPLAARAHLMFVREPATAGSGLAAAEYLEFIAAARRLGRREAPLAIAGALEATRIPGGARIDSLPWEVRRRLALAAALVARPPIVLLDESWAASEASDRSVAIGCLATLKRQGTTVVATLDEQDDPHRLFDTVIRMERGRILSVSASSTPAPAAGHDLTVTAEAR